MASYAQHFRYTYRRYNTPHMRVDMMRRPAVNGLRAAFMEGEMEAGNEGPESPVGPYSPKVVCRSWNDGADSETAAEQRLGLNTDTDGEIDARGKGEEKEEETKTKYDVETSWYDDSVSEPEKGDVDEDHTGRLKDEVQTVFELEGDYPVHSHVLQRPASAPYGNTIFELEAIEIPQFPNGQTNTSPPRRRSYPNCQRYSCFNYVDRDAGIYKEGRPIFLPAPAEEDPPFDGHTLAVEYVRSWFESDDFPEWTLRNRGTAAENENILDHGKISHRNRVEERLRRSLSFTRRRGNEMWARVRPRSGSVASFFPSSLMAMGGRSALRPNIRHLALRKRQSVGKV